mmetsp:Transcript_14892/g.42259  ORF Transcript_14892/g.42259 Transcript_14892/m.42259 type:complete len:616 (-) Transcript_14892:117-1964(-)
MGEDPPTSVEVPRADVGRIIGPNGSTLRRLMQATGCKIDIPRRSGGRRQDAGSDDDEAPVAVQLQGGPEQRSKAATAIRDIVDGGDYEDHAARADGAMVIDHNFEDYERRSWLTWKLVSAEHTLGIRVDMGRKAVRVWKAATGPALTGAKATAVREAIEIALAEAKELVELNIDVPIANEPENIIYDPAIRALTEQHGVIVRMQEAEEESRPVRVWGPAEPARDAAMLVEARWVKGKSTTGLLQAPGQVQAMPEAMANDFAGDLRSFEAELSVKVHMGHTILWISGSNAEAVAASKETLREMLQFYLPNGFSYNRELGPSDFVDLLRQDPALRSLAIRPEGAMTLESREGTGWLCGDESYRKPIEKRIEALRKRWAQEHWEMDLDNYGVAMWLLGPGGTGGWVQRMQAECGATIRVEPNSLKVKVEGKERNVEEGKRLVLDALEKLEQKRKAEEDISVREVAAKRSKAVLTEHPPHMQAVLESLRMLEARETEMKRRARMREWEMQEPPRGAAAVAAQGGQDAPAGPEAIGSGAEAPPSQEEQGRLGDDAKRDDWDMLRGLRSKVSEASFKPQIVPAVENRSAGIGRSAVGVPLDAVLQEPNDGPDGVADDDGSR